MEKLLKAISNAGTWLRVHAGWLLLICLGAFTGAALLRRKDNQINSLKAARQVEKAKAEIKVLETKRQSIAAKDREDANEVITLSASIAAKQKEIAALHEGRHQWDDLSDEQVRAALKNAGL